MASPLAPIASNQKFPCPSTLNVANFVSIKLSQTNFLLWKTQVLCLIESQDLQGFINGEVAAPDQFIITGSKQEINPNYLQWKRSDRLLRGWITEYESFITSMLKPPIPSYKEVVPLLQSHETMKQLNGHEENAHHQSVFYTHRSGFNNNRRGGRGKPTFSSHGRGFYPYNRGQQEKLGNLNQTSSNQIDCEYVVPVVASKLVSIRYSSEFGFGFDPDPNVPDHTTIPVRQYHLTGVPNVLEPDLDR
ncbi:hypothetical protein EJ110_NYTH27194 [Nymphaea thermarum]|nr:hypothetical protein EJ110_NYTH27194 [Nymphaea thermarum]